MPSVQLMMLGVIVSAFAIFMTVLLAVSIYVAAGRKPEKTKASVVIPARAPGLARH